MEKEKYTCAKCNQTYDKGWSDEEAKEEAKELFGSYPEKWGCGEAVICDDCFNEMFPKKEEAKKVGWRWHVIFWFTLALLGWLTYEIWWFHTNIQSIPSVYFHYCLYA